MGNGGRWGNMGQGLNLALILKSKRKTRLTTVLLTSLGTFVHNMCYFLTLNIKVCSFTIWNGSCHKGFLAMRKALRKACCSCEELSMNFYWLISLLSVLTLSHLSCYSRSLSFTPFSSLLYPSFLSAILCCSRAPCAGDRHDAKSTLWFPEAQVWWQVRSHQPFSCLLSPALSLSPAYCTNPLQAAPLTLMQTTIASWKKM